MKEIKKTDYVTKEELNERTKLSKMKTDQIYVTLPKGTKEILIEITGEKPAKACHDIILEYIKRLKSDQ